MSNDVIVPGDDGFDVAERNSGMIIGTMIKFKDGAYFKNKTEIVPLGTTLVALKVVTAWVHWGKDENGNGKPIEHRITHTGQSHPRREDLPDQDRTQWEIAFGQPSDPWKDTRYLYLINPQSGADFTFITDTNGGRKGIAELKNAISNVRFAHPTALPVVRLSKGLMPTSFNPNGTPYPVFQIMDWRHKTEGGPAPERLTHQERPEYDDDHEAEEVRLRRDFEDEIPF
jgi:hypothetical protein